MRPLAGVVVSGQKVLDALPGVRVDQRFVRAGVDGAAVVDLALVVGVVQDLLDGRDAERFAGPLGGFSSREPSVSEFVEEEPDGGVSFGVAIKGPCDVMRSFSVDLNDAVHPAKVVGDVDVPVAQWCPGDRATETGLLGESLCDFVGEVARIELGDAGHDAVHEHAGWGFVDVLASGDEGDPGLLEGEVDGNVVGAGAGQPVEFVDDAVVDRVVADVAQHFLQPGALVNFGAGLAGVDELGDDGRTQRRRLTGVGLALGRNGEALFPAPAGGLLGGGNTQVGDRGFVVGLAARLIIHVVGVLSPSATCSRACESAACDLWSQRLLASR